MAILLKGELIGPLGGYQFYGVARTPILRSCYYHYSTVHIFIHAMHTTIGDTEKADEGSDILILPKPGQAVDRDDRRFETVQLTL